MAGVLDFRRAPAPVLSRERVFLGAAALLFAITATATLVWGARMAEMPGMPMPGDWTMSMTWMRMSGQTWFGAANSFLGMWIVMMMAMMLPSLIPMLSRYRQAVGGLHTPRLALLTLLVGAGYFMVWTLLGLLIFPLGVALASLQMQWTILASAVPVAAGVIVVAAGALQFTGWKRQSLASCRISCGSDHATSATAINAWRHGLHLGLCCCYCCAGFTSILLVVGVMNTAVMALVTVAITTERLAPMGERIARFTGAAAIGAGLLMMARVL